MHPKRYRLLGLLFILIIFKNYGQSPVSFPSNQYRSPANHHYWKNKKPYDGYWQQDVHYKIEATIDDSANIIHGNKYTLTYWNNAPFQLTELYFHLHENAFQPGSHYHDLNINNDNPVTFGKHEQEGLGTTIEDLKINNQSVKTELDNTILKVQLNEPLKSGDSLIVTCTFKTYWDNGTMRRRNKFFETWNTKHFDGVHWYPIVAVYDLKSGWTVDQHLDKEFYANFGTFDVALTFPQEYIVEATGVLQNEQEVLPTELKQKINLKNFTNKPFNEPPSIIIPRTPGKTKTWIYHAENVHNFAFTADPTYRIGELAWNNIKVITLAQEPHAAKWQESGQFTLDVIKTYSTDFGMYEWPKIIVADAKDGMEYPMLTLDNGTYPLHQSLLAHEVGHMWFYGMLGSNETYRAFLDEGFTQFLTVWSMDKILGEKRKKIGANKFIDKYIDSSNTRYENLYYPYLNHVKETYDEPLNTHSSGFNGALRHSGNYGLVYYKTGTMLYNLRYVLGDTLFSNAMKHYVQKWKFAHPYPEDFKQAIIEYTQTDLNWFFDQWLETTKYIDYSISKIKKSKDAKGYNYKITFARKGRMQMPIDFNITTSENKSYTYTIPNTWFIKDSINKTVLPKWYGWDLLHPTYTASISLPSKIRSIEIDPQHYLADIDLTNNHWKNKKFSTTEFDHKIPLLTRWDKQRNYIRPALWYNYVDGIQIGLHVEGSYFSKYKYNATLWGNTTLGQYDPSSSIKAYAPLSCIFSINRSTNFFWNQSNVSIHASYYSNIALSKVEFEKTFRKQDQRNKRFSKILFSIKSIVNTDGYEQYIFYPTLWGDGTNQLYLFNNTFNVSFFKNFFYKNGQGDFTVGLRFPFAYSSFNYSDLKITLNHYKKISKLDIKSKLFSQLGLSNTYPLESALMLSGANNEDLLESIATRAHGLIPYEFTTSGIQPLNFHAYGGLNIRGYSGYQVFETIQINGVDTTVQGNYSNTGTSWNVEFAFNRLSPLQFKKLSRRFNLTTYLFHDMGMLFFNQFENLTPGKLRMSSGVGSTLSLKFSPYQINPVVLRLDLPLYLNSPPTTQNPLQLRFIIGLNKSF